MAGSAAGCGQSGPPPTALGNHGATPREAEHAHAALTGPDGTSRGTVSLEEIGDNVRIAILIEGVPGGTYAVHVHEHGRCTPDFTAAGGAWTSAGQDLKQLDPNQPLPGDRAILAIGQRGAGSDVMTVANAALWSGTNAMLDADGAAVVVHRITTGDRAAAAWDGGTRVACGVIRPGRGTWDPL